MSKKAQKGRPGRPALSQSDRKNRNLTFRSRDDLRDRLDEAARQSQRSISEEIERRLERSFLDQQLMTSALELAYVQGPAGVLLAIGEVMKDAGERANKASTVSPFWWKDPFAYDKALRGAVEVLEFFRPAGEVPKERFKGGPSDLNLIFDQLGVATAQSFLRKIAANDDEPRVVRVRSLLGPDLIERLPKSSRAEK
jgi:predicted transcriptional regulator